MDFRKVTPCAPQSFGYEFFLFFGWPGLQNLIKLPVRYAAVLGDADERYTVTLRHGPNHQAIITPFAHTHTLPQTINTRFIAALLRHSWQITFVSVRCTSFEFPFGIAGIFSGAYFMP